MASESFEPAPHTDARRARIYLLILLAVTILGLALRLRGIQWSLPTALHPVNTYHPDELINLIAAHQVDIPHGRLDTQFYSYGTLYFYIVSLAHTFVEGWRLASFSLPNDATPAQEAAVQATLFLIGRLVTAFMGTGVILTTAAIAKRCYGRRAGVLAAALYAVAPLAVLHAHFLTVDVPATLFVSLAVLWALRLSSAPTLRNGVVAGIFCGLAAATKYSAGTCLLAPATAYLLTDLSVRKKVGGIATVIGVAAVAFLVGCPGPFLNWPVFWNGLYPGSGVYYELFVHSRQGHGALFAQTGPGWWYHLVVSLRLGLGLPLLALSLLGIASAIARRRREEVIVTLFLVASYLLTSLSAVRFARYMLPLYPALCVLAAGAVYGMGAAAPRDRTRLLPTLAAAGVWFYTLLCAVAITHIMTLEDPRDTAAAYLFHVARPHAVVAFVTTPWFYSPPLSPLFGSINPAVRRAVDPSGRFSLRIHPTEWDPSVLQPMPDYVIISRYERAHVVDRLHETGPSAFMAQVAASYNRTVFSTPPLFGTAPLGSILPDDLAYIQPEITIYTPRRTSGAPSHP